MRDNIKHKGYIVQNMMCQLNHQLSSRTAKTDANLANTLKEQMCI
jgi:hypothetical protein